MSRPPTMSREQGSTGLLESMQRWKWWLLCAAASVLTALALHHNNLVHLSSKAIGTEGDRDWYVFLAWKMGQALRAGTSPFSLEGLTSPHGFNVFVTDGFLPPLTGGFLNLLLSPVLAYNVLLIASTAIGVAAGIYLATEISSVHAVRLITGVAIATTPVLFIRFHGHFTMPFVFPVTLVIAETVHLVRSSSLRWIRLTIWLFLAFGSTAYYLLISLGVLLVGLVVVTLHDRSVLRTAIPRLAISMCILGLAMSPFLIQRSRLTQRELDGGSTLDQTLVSDGEYYNADVLAEALPTYPTWLSLPFQARFEHNVVYVSGEGNYSFPGLLLATVGVGGLVASRRREVRAVLAAAMGLWVFTLGPVADVFGGATMISPAAGRIHWLPFEALHHINALSTLRAPGRLSLGIPPMLGVGSRSRSTPAFRARSREATWQRATLPLVALVAVALATNVPNLPAARMPGTSPGSQAMLTSLGDRPGDVGRVLYVPSCAANFVGVESSLQIWHGLDMVGCDGPYLALPFASEMSDYPRRLATWRPCAAHRTASDTSARTSRPTTVRSARGCPSSGSSSTSATWSSMATRSHPAHTWRRPSRSSRDSSRSSLATRAGRRSTSTNRRRTDAEHRRHVPR